MRPKPFFKQGLHDASAAILLLMEKAGGPTALGIRCGTSGQTISDAIERKRVSDSALAHIMADVADELGEPWITSRVLAGLERPVLAAGPDPSEETGSDPNVDAPLAGLDEEREPGDAQVEARGPAVAMLSARRRASRSARSSNRRRKLAAPHLRLVGDHASNG